VAVLYNFHEPHDKVLAQIVELYTDLYKHEGYGSMSVEIRFLKRGQKEILIRCGKDYRYVVDYSEDQLKVASKVKSMQVAI
jgi:hypothetical protein